MEDNRFFRFIGRANSVALLAVLVGALLIGGYNLIEDLLPDHKPPAITNIAPDPAGQEKWSLGRPVPISGTQFAYLPLVSEKKEIALPEQRQSKTFQDYGGSYMLPSRNLLFVSKKNSEMHWLYPSNGQLIAGLEMLAAEELPGKDRVTTAILYQIIKKDTNNDGRLTLDDQTDLSLSHPDGSQNTEIAKTVERIIGTISLLNRDVLILYQAEGKAYAATVRLEDMLVLHRQELPTSETTH